MSDLQWKKLKVLGVGSYGTVYLAIVVDEQTPCQSFIAVKSGGCQEIIRCFRTETTVEHGCHFYNLFLEYAPNQFGKFYNLFLEYAPYSSLADLIHKKPFPETQT
ncbi:uncharacterized protein DS421_4g115730 [Arachis hypogaea]|uniref:Protein kinase domain-containing protein n=1 Tax=Arachis hypogaea TaxID=3818 RepID=A0A444WP83_ARAHY|nr:uncharacterized protein DS421_4g115730 [Arachis hypogaea]RYQ79131.1 hypothetical protein Ahy_Scaffold6g107832 [Arachis hypogaea]RYQ79133.1 hypothetical protein Ahy_Scaffold6g107835 [Arachis hypogaea]